MKSSNPQTPAQETSAILQKLGVVATAIKKGPLGRIERLESSISANQAALNEVCNQSQRTRKRLERAVGDVNGLLR